MNEWIAKTDTFAEDGEFPWWDNANYTAGAMRASGFVGTMGWALVFDVIAYGHRESCIQRKIYAFGPGADHLGYVCWTELLDRSAFVEDLDPNTVRSRITGVVLRSDAPGRMIAEAPPSGVARTCTLKVLGHDVTFETDPTSLPGVHAPAVRPTRLSPNEVALFRICDALPREVLFSPAGYIAERVGVHGARRTFFYDDWQHVACSDPPSSSPDIVAMVEALAAGEAPRSLAGRPNSTYRAFLRDIIDGHPDTDDLMWGPPSPAHPR